MTAVRNQPPVIRPARAPKPGPHVLGDATGHGHADPERRERVGERRREQQQPGPRDHRRGPGGLHGERRHQQHAGPDERPDVQRGAVCDAEVALLFGSSRRHPGIVTSPLALWQDPTRCNSMRPAGSGSSAAQGETLRSSLERELRRAILDGSLRAGAQLPSSRVLARPRSACRAASPATPTASSRPRGSSRSRRAHRPWSPRSSARSADRADGLTRRRRASTSPRRRPT